VGAVSVGYHFHALLLLQSLVLVFSELSTIGAF
jgi:hypothetical protein